MITEAKQLLVDNYHRFLELPFAAKCAMVGLYLIYVCIVAMLINRYRNKGNQSNTPNEDDFTHWI